MSTTKKPTAAETLLNLLPHGSNNTLLTDEKAEAALTAFIADIRTLDKCHNKCKQLTEDQLAEQVFRRNPTFEKEQHAVPYFRYQLRIALEELVLLEEGIRKLGAGSITGTALSSYSNIVRDYLFDLRKILGFLQKNHSNWRFFEGGKNANVVDFC